MVLVLKTDGDKLAGCLGGLVEQQNEAGHDTEIAHGHQQEISDDRFRFHTAVYVLADIIERFQVKSPQIELSLDIFSLLERFPEVSDFFLRVHLYGFPVGPLSRYPEKDINDFVPP